MQLTKPITLPRPGIGSISLRRPGIGSLGLRRQKQSALAGVSIDAGGIAVAQVESNGSIELTGFALEPLRPGVFHEGEVVEADALAEALKSTFSEHKLSKRIQLGIGNQRVIVRTLRLPAIEDPKEMDAAIRFQAQEQIPMPLDQAVLQHQVVGGVPAEEGSPPQVVVVVIAARRDMITSFVEPIRRAGLEPEGIDLAAFGMIRALTGLAVPSLGAGDQAPAPIEEAFLYCEVGDVLNLAVARGRGCLFTRVSGTGMQAIVGRLASERAMTPELAVQWLLHVGLEGDLEQIEGDPELVAATRTVLRDGVANLADELRLSLDYYRALDSAVPVAGVFLCGVGSAIQGLAGEIQETLRLPVHSQRPASLADLDPAVGARLVLPFGLAQES
jgi:type IV pilus assembly protein PilM